MNIATVERPKMIDVFYVKSINNIDNITTWTGRLLETS